MDTHALHRAPSQRSGERGVLQESLERRAETRRSDPAVITLTGIADGLEVLRRVVDDDGGARPHRLEEGRVRAPHLGGLDEAVGAREQLAVPLAEEVAGEDYAGIGRRVQ